MHAVGQWFPRGDRSPAIVPVTETEFANRMAVHPSLQGWQIGRTQRVSRGFYTSQAMELVPA
jgi:magnesium-protoporphyrin O-methyltransferase